MGDHLQRTKAPAIAGRGFTVTATFDTKTPQGVIVAQGGAARGYALFLKDGKPSFAVRAADHLTSIAARESVTGRHTVVARLHRTGVMTLTLDGQPVAEGKAPRLIETMPVDGLDVGSDREGLVGSYPTENQFQGTIESVCVELD